MDGPVDVLLRLERLIPRGVRPVRGSPWPARDRLDDLHRDISLAAGGEHLVEGLPVTLVLGEEEIERQEHRVEVEAREASAVHGGDGPPVAGDADEARQALRARLDRCLERAPRSHGLVPVVRMAERVELDQVDVIDAQPVERAVNVLAGLRSRARAGFRREEEILPVTRHPGTDAELGVPVPRGGVDVVDAVTEQHFQRAVRIRLAGPGQRGRAEERHRALVARPSEHPLLDHRPRASTMVHPASAIGRARSPRERAWASLAVPASTRPMIPCAMAESLNIENAT